jgi:CubicO group peptidase (beta-lactamase class C family)
MTTRSSIGSGAGPAGMELPDGRWINGSVEAGFGGVMDAFVANFTDRGDVGAACAAYVDGRRVVDVWGGIADARTGRPWGRDTTAVIFSCSKGLLAICAYRLVQEGRLDLDQPVGWYWPAFAGQGKSTITIRQAMSHRAGLAALDRDLDLDEVLAWDPVIRAIEDQQPQHHPRDGHLYHAMTYGWLVGEVIRRVTGMTPGRYFHEVFGGPLGLRTWIGLPEEARSSVAWMEPPMPDEDSAAARESARIAGANTTVLRSVSMGGAFAFPVDDGVVSFNDPVIQAGEIPGANGISDAESLARLYASCVTTLDGPPILSGPSIENALLVQSSGQQLSGMPDDGARWGTGFQLSSPPSQPMLGPGSFGHAGAGGQLAFADRDHRAGFAYLGNQMGGHGDARARELTLAFRRALGA